MSELKLEAHEISWIIEEKIRNGPYSHLIPEKFKVVGKTDVGPFTVEAKSDLGPWPWPKSPEVKKKEKKK